MSNLKKTICHLTTVHPRNDIRIFLKECTSLMRNGYKVNLVVADGKEDDHIEDISIHGLEKPKNKLSRVFVTPFKIARKALELDADLYHFHDPELIIAGLFLRLKGRKVIYDIHEDLPRQLFVQKNKLWIKRKTMEFILDIYEDFAAKRFNGIVTATPHIGKRFKKINKRTEIVNNFPIKDELSLNEANVAKENQVCYVGGIIRVRGIIEMVKALEYGDTKLNICGKFSTPELKEETMKLKGWSNVIDHGFSTREEVSQVMGISMAGLVLFKALPNHINAQPNKLFEYMSASLPIIMSNFEQWKEIVDRFDCGICVDPENPEEIAGAIKKIKDNPEQARKMGRNARRAVEEVYNWNVEEKKLLGLYASILN